MLIDEIAGSAQTQPVVRLHSGLHWDRTRICVLRAPRLTLGADGASQAWTSVPPSRAANDTQLAWPYLAPADDWYAA